MVKMVEPKLNGGTHTYVYVETSCIRNLPWAESHVYLPIMFDLFVMFFLFVLILSFVGKGNIKFNRKVNKFV